MIGPARYTEPRPTGELSREAIEGFAGQDIEKAVFYPEDEVAGSE
jgi:hypothetical protein